MLTNKYNKAVVIGVCNGIGLHFYKNIILHYGLGATVACVKPRFDE